MEGEHTINRVLKDMQIPAPPPQRTLLVMHGMPAVGKLTVATALEAALAQSREGESWCLYHNHMVVDDVLTRHDFGTPGFVRERDDLWRSGIVSRLTEPNRVAQGGGVIFTYSTENSVPPAFLSWLFDDCCNEAAAATAIDESLLPPIRMVSVCLIAEQHIVMARVDSDARKERKKLQDKHLYERLIEEGVFLQPVVPRTDFVVDTTDTAPEAVAAAILTYLFP
jgi:hypothetical protein